MRKNIVHLTFLALCAVLTLPFAARAAEQIPPGGPRPVEHFIATFEKFPETKGAKGEGERLHELFDLAWQSMLETTPEMATYMGLTELNDRWGDYSFEGIEKDEKMADAMRVALASIDRGELGEEDRVHYDLMDRMFQQMVEGRRFPGEVLAVSQMSGPQQNVPQMFTVMPTRTVDQYEDVISRLRGVPKMLDQITARLQKGLETGVTPPKITLRDLPQQVLNVIPDDPMESALLRPFTRFPEGIPAAEQERLKAEAVKVYTESAAPAFRKFHRFLAEKYVPGARESIAMGALPDGQEWYAYNAKTSTTTDLTPRQIHEIGLSEVKRIRSEMEKVIEQTDFEGSFEEFLDFLRTDPRFFYETPEELLAGYRDIAKRVDPELVKLFGRLPQTPYGVEPIPSYAEKSQTTAYYEPGNLEAARPGTFFANTYDLKSRPKWEMEALTLHEAVPGHHLQISLAQEMMDVPKWRRFNNYTAFAEGWGLYAESLGEEIGFYQDPYAKFGQLTYEMWRAIRLVVDTGMHSLGWTRDQAIDYFKKNSGKAQHDIVVEVDRYIVWPGQALAYKIGELKIKELRAFAEQELGEKFDVRAFHDEVLGNGALPLNVLEANVREWVSEQKTPKVERGEGPVGR
jgi:uncharacterized protein (DUF885 family)